MNVAVVTGAAGGLGAAVADRLAQAGAALALLDRSSEGLDALRDELAQRHGVQPLVLTCDVADGRDVDEAAREVERRLGACDVLVNNAAVLRRAWLEDHPEDVFDDVLAVNLRGPFLCTRAFGRTMLAAGAGSIVNVASIAARGPTPAAGAYCMAKAGLLALTRQTAVEWGPRGVRANAVSPGFMATAMSAGNYADDDLAERRADRVPVGRIGDTGEVARVIAFLASADASYVNGTEVTVDGGLVQTLAAGFPRASAVQP